MFGKQSVLVVLLVVALVGPAFMFNSDVRDVRSVENANVAVGTIGTIPYRSPGNIDLSPTKLAAEIATISVADPSAANAINPSQSGLASPPPLPLENAFILPGDANGPNFNAQPLEFLPINNLADVFRFDIDTNWLRSRWKRVAVAPSENGLNGLRVALVTGVNLHDLFGSLTYYFDKNQTLQKISFRGWSGNPNTLIRFLQQGYNFKKQPSNSAGLYVAKNWRRPTGALYLQHAASSTADNPTQQIAILLELNNPGGRHQLTPEVAAMIFNSPR